MPRQPRFNLADIPQHVVQRGNNRQATFFADADYDRYLEYLKSAAEAHCCEVHAYVLMPNHVHLLVTPRTDAAVSKLMQTLGGRYVQYVNAAYGRTGTLWGGRYKASVVDSERYLLTCYRYIELNPVRANMVRHPADYPWSSYRHHGVGEINDLIVEHPLYGALGRSPDERRSAYRGLFPRQVEGEPVIEIRAELNKARVLGGERFREEIEARVSRSVRPAKRGRPRKERPFAATATSQASIIGF